MKNKYELIIEYIEKLEENGEIKQGDKLPSIRALSVKFKCNKATVIRAYNELETKHKLYSIPKSGYYFIDKKELDLNKDRIYDFADTVPDSRLLPYKEFNHCVNKAVELYKANLFSYGDPQGLQSLRQAIVKYFSQQQIFTKEDNVFITSGSQQALSILLKMKFPNKKKKILVEQPTYSLIHKIVQLNEDEIIGIKRDNCGLDFKELERILKEEDIKVFYTIPRFHNPLGTSYTEKDKEKLIKLCEKYDVYIIEDDYLGDLDINKKNLPLFYYDIYDRVIYVKSFSKTFMPGIRVGAVVMYDKLKEEFLNHKKCIDLNTSVLSQGGLEIYINSGMYKKHIKKTQTKYMSKMQVLKGALEKIETKGVEYLVHNTGFFVWITIPKVIDVKRFAKRLEEKKVYIVPADKFYIGEKTEENSFRLCIAKLKEEEIKKGVEIILTEINKMS